MAGLSVNRVLWQVDKKEENSSIHVTTSIPSFKHRLHYLLAIFDLINSEVYAYFVCKHNSNVCHYIYIKNTLSCVYQNLLSEM